MNVAQKVVGLADTEGEQKLLVTHITIRQSVFILIVKLILIEIFATVGMILIQQSSISQDSLETLRLFVESFGILLSVFLAIFKIVLEILVVFQWLENYYEITPGEVIHRSGLLFKKERRDYLEHLSGVKIIQGAGGKLFNYGSLQLKNWYSENDMLMYSINNPKKYHDILRKLLPKADREKEIFREKFIEDEEKE